MFGDIIIGAIIGCATCCLLFHHFGLINYDLILKLIEGYTENDTLNWNVRTPEVKRVIARANTNFFDSPEVQNKSQEVENKSQQMRRRKKRRTLQIDDKEKNNHNPFNSPYMGEKEPLWDHRYSAMLQAAASNLYLAWREQDADGWYLSSSLPSGLKIFRKPNPPGIDIVKGSMMIPYPVDMIMQEIFLRESILKYDESTQDFKTLTTYGPGMGVGYWLVNPSRFVTPRDFVSVYGVCLTEKNGNTILVPHTGVVFDTCPPKSGRVRGEVNFSGWIFEVKSPGRTMATYIVDVDAKGSLPNWVVNATADNAAKTPFNLTKFLKNKHGPYVPPKRSNFKRAASVPQQIDEDGLISGLEDETEDSCEESCENTSVPFTDQAMTESLAPIQLLDRRLSVKKQAAITKKLNLAIANLMKFTDSSSKKLWRKTSSSDRGIAIYRRKGGKNGFMGMSIVSFHPQKIYDAIREPSFRKSYDPMLKSLQIVEQFGDCHVIHMHHRTKKCIAKLRHDVLIATESRQVGTKYVCAGTSITHPACPENPNMKRINIGTTGWVVEEYRKQASHSRVSFVLDADFGNLPSNVVGFVNKRQVMVIHDLALAIKQRDEIGTL